MSRSVIMIPASAGAVDRPVRFSTSPLPVRLQGICSVSDDNMPSRGNSALINTPSRPGHALSVTLSGLKREEPFRITLTTESAHRAHSRYSLEDLCRATYSLKIESEVPENDDTHEGAESMPEVPKARENCPMECTVCLGERREVVVMPCFHYALCACCARILQESGQPCPICRTEIVNIQKLHIP